MKNTVLGIALVATVTALGLFTSCQKQSTGGLVLNEICGKDADGLEWVEIANTSDQAISLNGYKLRKTDEEGIDKKLYEFPDTTIAPGAIYMVNTEDLKASISHKKAIIIDLEDADGNILDSFDSMEELNLDHHPKGASYARVPNLTGKWTLSSCATWNASNDQAGPAPEASDDDEDLDEEE